MSAVESNPGGANFNRVDERWRLVERIVASRHFARAPQLREFLLFVSRRVLLEGRQEVGEAEIACKVLGRAADFSPKEDNIVRVQARHLRTKLDAYFETDGVDEPLRLKIPTRSYLPIFEPRSPLAPTESEQTPERPRWPYALAAALLLCVLLAAFLVLRGLPHTPVAGAAAKAPNPILGRVFRPGETTYVVVSDNGVSSLQDYLRVDVTLDQYLRPGFLQELAGSAPAPEDRSLLQRMVRYAITSLTDAAAAARLAQQAVKYGSSVVVRSPRHLNARDFLSGNFVTLGGPRGNPWVQLFQDRLNFRGVSNPKERQFWYENKSPLPGEQQRYGYRLGEVSDSYALIVLLPNPEGKGIFLLLMGQTMDGNEAAEQFVEQARLPKELADWLKSDDHSAEMLIRVRGVQVSPWSADLVAFRKIDANAQPGMRSLEHLQSRP